MPADACILPFTIDELHCGLALECVREVVRAVSISRLPAAPGIIEGIIDLRGVIVPIVDMRRRFGLPPRATELSDRFIIAEGGNCLMGLHVDTVDPITRLDPELIQETEDASFARRMALAGVGKIAGGILLVYALGEFFSDAETQAIDAALSEWV